MAEVASSARQLRREGENRALQTHVQLLAHSREGDEFAKEEEEEKPPYASTLHKIGKVISESRSRSIW